MPDTSVKYLHSGMPGAPVLSGTAGALINVLDACLVNGFASAAVTSLVVASNVATLTVSGGHSAEVGSVIVIAGATPSGLNGEQKVVSVGGGNTTLTFATTGIADQTATGSITVKLAGAGWTKPWSGTNLAAYKSGDVAATGCLLRVDDTAARVVRCVGYESMTGISAGSGPFPTPTQRSGGSYWPKSNVADASSRGWVVVADDRMFYLLTFYHASYANIGAAFVAFGDLVPAYSGDSWACVLSGHPGDYSGSNPSTTDDYGYMTLSTSNEFYLARSFAGLGGSVRASRAFLQIVPGSSSVPSGDGLMQYPNGPDQGLYLTPINVLEQFFNCLRGGSPGLYGCSQNLPEWLFAAGDRIPSVVNLIGREIRVLPFGQGVSSGWYVFFDTTGPWR